MPVIDRSRSVRARGGAATEELGVRAHRGERRAELVRGVGDEATQALVGRLDPVEHRVERGTEPSDFRLRIGMLDPKRQVAGRDRDRRLLDLP